VDAMRDKREALLKPHEDKLNEFRKKQLNHDTEYEFAQMMAQYGEIVKNIDKDMAAYEVEYKADLEAKRLARRQMRLKQAEERKKETE